MSAKYIVFSSNSKAYMSGGDVRYFVSEASARCLNESICSIAKINYKKRAIMEEKGEDKNSGRVILHDDGDDFWDEWIWWEIQDGVLTKKSATDEEIIERAMQIGDPSDRRSFKLTPIEDYRALLQKKE